MRVILAALLVGVLTACTTTTHIVQPPPAAGTSATGAPTSRAAVDAFFASIKAMDIQATAAVFGTKDGSVRDRMARDEVEMRVVIMQCYFSHDSMRILGTPRQKSDSTFYKVELSKGSRTQQSDVVTIAGPHSRWYVAAASPPQVPGCGE